MTTQKLKRILLFLLMFIYVCALKAYTFSIGAGGFFQYSPYNNEDYNFYPVPIIKYDSKYFYFDTPYAGLHIFKKDGFELNIQAEYTTLDFKSKDHNSNMRFLKDRNAAITTGLQGVVWGKYGILKSNISIDTAGNSGIQGKLSYLLQKEINKNILIVPETGLKYFSAKHNRYFFGVSREESLNTGFTQYSSSDSLTPYIGLSVVNKINKNVKFVLMGQYSPLSSKIKNSPIVDKNKEFIFYTNLTYEF
ncbi:outer membrane protein [Elusimicrobium posterum]|uniref:MipA/OmpV family protein n=1 Tax=Elusimicrobium posterum TaxID=3116653 RepID=UPI003C736C0A